MNFESTVGIVSSGAVSGHEATVEIVSASGGPYDVVAEQTDWQHLPRGVGKDFKDCLEKLLIEKKSLWQRLANF